jgi:hypothetical protein
MQQAVQHQDLDFDSESVPAFFSLRASRGYADRQIAHNPLGRGCPRSPAFGDLGKRKRKYVGRFVLSSEPPV